MGFSELIQAGEPVLAEGSIYENLKRNPKVRMDEHIYYSSLIYDDYGASVLEQAHRGYLDIGQRLNLPMMAVTDTWRANAERIAQSQFSDRAVNRDDVVFLRAIRDSYGSYASKIFIGGQIGPRGDAYRPDEALDSEAAREFHRPQLEELAQAGVDFLLASTLPAFSEAQGIARVMAETGLPYALSFVIRRDATILDGTPLAQAIRELDRTMSVRPTGVFVNCVHPGIFAEAIERIDREAPEIKRRILGLFANTSDLDPEQLDGSENLLTEEPGKLASLMGTIRRSHGFPIMGGCCGTDSTHIHEIGKMLCTTV